MYISSRRSPSPILPSSRRNRLNARAAVLLGDNELAQSAATLRDLDSGEQSLVPLSELAARLKAIAG